MEMFAQAARLALRFQTSKGNLSVEDLWNLPLASTNPDKVSLEGVARSLQNQLKNQDDGASFFGAATVSKAAARAKKELQLKFDIVKFIGEQLVKERDLAERRRVARENNQRVLELIDKKQNAEMEGKSLEELRALLQAGADVGLEDDES